MSHVAVPAVYLIAKREEKILLMRREGSGYFDGWYGLPAGHVEKGELPMQTLVRESQEEAGIAIDATRTRLAHAMYRTAHDATGDRVDYFFETDAWEGEPRIMEPHKCSDVLWAPLTDLPQNTVPSVRDALDAVRRGKIYSELDRAHTIPSPSRGD